jgi:phosphoribosyl 1,2-cyclic phosphodiesterase
MRMTVLASGSKGNSTVISSDRTSLLIDAGLSCRELLRRMAATGEDPTQLDAILITHEHIDHHAAMPVLARKLGIPVYFTEPTHRAWVRMMTPRTTMTYAQWLDHLQAQKLARAEATTAACAPNATAPPPPDPALEDSTFNATRHRTEDLIAAAPAPTRSRAEDPDPEDCAPELAEKAKADPCFLPRLEYFQPGRSFLIGDITVSPFTTPHDAADPCGFVFEADGVRMATATDLGYIPPNVKAALKNVDVLLLESNHDLEMLRDGPYPWSVKQRVLSRVGHLSNEATAQFLERDYDGGAQWVILGHISESNNVPELARLAAEQALANRMSLLGNRLLLAMQSDPLDPINV